MSSNFMDSQWTCHKSPIIKEVSWEIHLSKLPTHFCDLLCMSENGDSTSSYGHALFGTLQDSPRDSVGIISIPKRPTPPTLWWFLSEFPHRNGWFLASKPLNSSESPIVSTNQPPASPIVSHERWSTHPWLSS